MVKTSHGSLKENDRQFTRRAFCSCEAAASAHQYNYAIQISVSASYSPEVYFYPPSIIIFFYFTALGEPPICLYLRQIRVRNHWDYYWKRSHLIAVVRLPLTSTLGLLSLWRNERNGAE